MSELRIVPCSDGEYRVGSESFFPDDNQEQDKEFPRVVKGVYSSGKDKKQQEKARKFLKEIGVGEVTEARKIEAMLEKRYSDGEHVKPDIKDIKRFVALVKNRDHVDLFADYFIFKLADGKWGTPSHVYLDAPFCETGLSAYYCKTLAAQRKETLKEAIKAVLSAYYGETLAVQRRALSKNYYKIAARHCGISLKEIGEFAKKLGAQTELEPKKQSIPRAHPERSQLHDNGRRSKKYGTDQDYDLSELDALFRDCNLKKFKLIWDTMNKLSNNCLEAKYNSNSRYPVKTGHSSLVWRLRRHEWVPQRQSDSDNYFFVKPADADMELLPEGFDFKTGTEWLKAIEFGKAEQDRKENERRKQEQKSEKYQRKQEAAKQLEFDSVDDAQEAKELLKLKRENPEFFKKLSRHGKNREFEQAEPIPSFGEALNDAFSVSGKAPLAESIVEGDTQNPSRRRERTRQDIANAIENEDKSGELSYLTIRKKWKGKNDQVRTAFIEWYGGKCQICEKTFMQQNGKPYFEGLYLVSHTTAKWIDRVGNVLCLCAEHSAKFQFGPKEIDENIIRQVMQLKIKAEGGDVSPAIRMNLCGKRIEIVYAEKHLIDLQEMIRASQNVGY